jgi:hypothetical protein
MPAQQLASPRREHGRCRVTRRIQGLSETAQISGDGVPDGVFLVRVDRAQYRWHSAKPFYRLRFSILEPPELAGRMISGRVHCTAKALWKLGWFLRDFLYDPELLGREEVDYLRASRRGQDQPRNRQWHFPAQLRWVRARQPMGRAVVGALLEEGRIRGRLMTYSYTQISQYLSCPRRYRYRPTSMRSDTWTAPVACWSGRPRPAGIRRNPRDC